MKIVAIIVAGYLGAGKTTLINRALEERQGLRSLVLVNDFGDINIDASLIAQSTDNIISLVNGCACCQIGDDLTQTLEALISRLDQFDRVILEASGVANLANLRCHFEGLAEHFLLQEVLVVDGSRTNDLIEDKYVGQHIRAQIACARNILVTRLEYLDSAGRKRLTNLLNTLNEKVFFVDGLDSLAECDVELAIKSEKHPGFHSHVVAGKEPLDTKILEDWLAHLPDSIHRVKGYIETEGGWVLLQYVPGTTELVSVDIQSIPQNYLGKLSVVCAGENIHKGRLTSPWLQVDRTTACS